jgi:ATP-dependent Clp protease adapter protein ClpS
MGTHPEPNGHVANEPLELPEEPLELPDEDVPFELPDDTTDDTIDDRTEYDLVLLRDGRHSFEYVIAVLRDVFGFSWEEGLELTLDMHLRGLSTVFTGSWKQVQRKRADVIAFGPDAWSLWSTGPLTVEVRLAE